MSADARLAHLAGYGAIAAVLASAQWSGLAGSLVGWLFALAVAVILVNAGVERARGTLRAEAERAIADGGVDAEQEGA